GGGGGQVHRRHLSVPHDLLAADEDVADGALGGGIHQAAERVAYRAHRGGRDVDHHEVGLGALLQPANIVALQGGGAAEGGGVEDVAGAEIEGIAGDEARRVERVAQFLQHVVRIGVRAHADVEAAAALGADRLHRS